MYPLILRWIWWEWIRLYDDLQVYLDRKNEYSRYQVNGQSHSRIFIALTTREALGKQNFPQQTSMTWYYNLFWTQKTHFIKSYHPNRDYILYLSYIIYYILCIYIYIMALFHQHVFFWYSSEKSTSKIHRASTLALSNLLRSNKAWETSWPRWLNFWMHLIFGHVGSFFWSRYISCFYQPWIVAFNFCAENEDLPWKWWSTNNWNIWRFPKMEVPQIIHVNRGFHYKPSILGYHYFRKPPYDIWIIRGLPLLIWDTLMAAVSRTHEDRPRIGGFLSVPSNIWVFRHFNWDIEGW